MKKENNITFATIDQVVYGQRNLYGNVDPYKARITAYLADVILPLTIVPTVYAQNRVLSQDDELSQIQIETKAKNLTKFDIERLLRLGTMIGLRNEAQILVDQFLSLNLSAESDRVLKYFRKAVELQARMHNFVLLYLKDNSDITYLEDISNIEAVIKKIQKIVNQKSKILKEIAESKKGDIFDIKFILPIDVEKNNDWDQEEIGLYFKDGKLKWVQIHELFSYTKFCEVVSDLQNKAVVPATYQEFTSPKEPIYPIFIFSSKLSPKLSKKLGKVEISSKVHDYGELQHTIILDTANITESEAWELIATYIRTVNKYPRVPKRN